MRALRRHLSYANVAASLALFVALTTGIAFALENNSVRSKHVAPDALKGKDIEEASLGAVPSLALEIGEVTADELMGVAGSGEMIGRIDNAPNGTTFAFPLGGSTPAASEAGAVMGNSLQAMEATDIEVSLLAGEMPVATSRTFTLRAGSSVAGMQDTGLTCTIEAEEESCSEEVGEEFGQLDDLFSIEVSTTGTPGSQDFGFGYRLTPQGGFAGP